MLTLDKMEISGFKSFSDRTEVRFPAGITAVVGPNGCGKSNIGDAINWALGEHGFGQGADFPSTQLAIVAERHCQGRLLAVDRPPAPRLPAELETRPAIAFHLAAEAEPLAAVAAAVGDPRGAEAAGGGQQVDRLEEAGLAGPVVAEEEMGPGLEGAAQGLEVAEPFGFELDQHGPKDPCY